MKSYWIFSVQICAIAIGTEIVRSEVLDRQLMDSVQLKKKEFILMTASNNNIPKNRESNLASVSGNDPSRMRFRNIYCVTGTERLRPKHNQKRSLGQRQRWQNKLPNFVSLPLLKFSMESPKKQKEMGINPYHHKIFKKQERWYTQARSFRKLHCTNFCQDYMKRRANLRGNECKGKASLGSKWVGPQLEP